MSNICYPFILTGLFARGNSHVIRLAVPLHLLLQAFADEDETDAGNADESDGGNADDARKICDDMPETTIDESEKNNESQSSLVERESNNPLSGVSTKDGDDVWTTIYRPAVKAAQSIVTTCLHHVCK